MRWSIEVWMIEQHAKSLADGYWASCCWVFSGEMLGIVERALVAAGQRVRITKHE